jgi:hypothetical protein
MCAYALQSWTASNEAVAETKSYVAIQGRGEGFLSWLLSLIGIAPTASLAITGEDVKLTENNFSGDGSLVIPLEQVSSVRYGWSRPWRAAVWLAAIIVGFGYMVAAAGHGFVGMGIVVLGAVVAVVVYLQSRTLVIGFGAVGGERLEFHFRPGKVGGEAVGPAHAAYVTDLALLLVEKRKHALAEVRP